MAYNNNFNNSRFNSNRYNNSYNGGGGYSNNSRNNGYQQPKKHSGCTYGQDKNGNPYVRGWKFDRQNGLRSFLAVPYKGTHSVTSKSGQEWHNFMVKVTPQGAKPYIVSGLYHPATRRVIIPDLQYVMNPKGGRGGYVGPFYTRNK